MNTNITTKSGKPLLMGTGSGTKWKSLKRDNPEDTGIPRTIVDQIRKSIELGFTHIDTAEAYTTQPEVGEAMSESKVPREDLFLTTKYSPGSVIFEKTSKGPLNFARTALGELKTDYIDLLLLHHTFFDASAAFGYTLESAWRELIQAKKEGLVRYIGVSNSPVEHLKVIIAISEKEGPEYLPKVNQIEFHPYLQDQSPSVVEFSKQHDILVEGYGPLTPLFRVTNEDGSANTSHPLTKLLPDLASKYQKTEAQILLRYALQKGVLPVTTSSKEERIKESLAVYNFELSNEDVKAIDDQGLKFKYRTSFQQRFA